MGYSQKTQDLIDDRVRTQRELRWEESPLIRRQLSNAIAALRTEINAAIKWEEKTPILKKSCFLMQEKIDLNFNHRK